MAHSRSQILNEMLRPRIVRIWLGTVAGVGTYDVFSNQFGLWPLRKIIGMSGALMPSWGWTMLFLSGLFYALFEYVRLNSSPAIPAAVTPTLAERAQANRDRLQDGMPSAATAAKSLRAKLGAWVHVDQFKVSDAACLWAGILPGASYMADKVRHPAIVAAERLIVSELGGDVNMGEVRFGSDDVTEGTLDRYQLLKLAEKKGARPSFLYPDA